jgi:hypothetical protein
MSSVCSVVKRALGVGECTQLPQLIRSMITTSPSFKFTAEQVENGTVEAAMQAAILATGLNRIHAWPFFDTFENVSEDPVYEELPLGILPVRDGNYRFRFGIAQSMCLHTKMFTHRSKSGRVFLIDSENQLIGTSDSDGNLLGFSVQLLHTEKLMLSDGTVATKSPIYLALRDNKELDAAGSIISAPFFNTVNKLTDVKLTVISAADDEIVVSVTIECDGTPVEGLEAADFVLLDGDGAAQSIGGATETDEGIYTLTGSGWVNGTINLDDPADLSIVDTLALQAYATPVVITT